MAPCPPAAYEEPPRRTPIRRGGSFGAGRLWTRSRLSRPIRLYRRVPWTGLRLSRPTLIPLIQRLGWTCRSTCRFLPQAPGPTAKSVEKVAILSRKPTEKGQSVEEVAISSTAADGPRADTSPPLCLTPKATAPTCSFWGFFPFCSMGFVNRRQCARQARPHTQTIKEKPMSIASTLSRRSFVAGAAVLAAGTLAARVALAEEAPPPSRPPRPRPPRPSHLPTP